MKCTLEEFIYTFPSKYREGFLQDEIREILYEFDIKLKEYAKNSGINTCMIIGKEIISFKHDVLRALELCIYKKTNIMWD